MRILVRVAAALAIFALAAAASACSSATATTEPEPTPQQEMATAGIPAELIPAYTEGRTIEAIELEPSDLSGIEPRDEAVFVKVTFDDGLVYEASSEDSIRPNAIILADHAGQMAMQPGYSQVSTPSVAATLSVATVGELPALLMGSRVGLHEGAAIQWSDGVWFYSVAHEGADELDDVLAFARSIGQ